VRVSRCWRGDGTDEEGFDSEIEGAVRMPEEGWKGGEGDNGLALNSEGGATAPWEGGMERRDIEEMRVEGEGEALAPVPVDEGEEREERGVWGDFCSIFSSRESGGKGGEGERENNKSVSN